jgi:outer membrane receptor protein involved in Fe transport
MAIVCVAVSCPAEAAGEISLDVSGGPLNVALVSLASQAGASIDTSDPALRSVRVDGLKGRYTLREGLRRLLQGTGYDFRISRGNVVRLVRRPPRRVRSAPSPRPTAATGASGLPATYQPAPPEPIFVTASKQDVPTADYPGAVHVASFGQAHGLHVGGMGSEALFRVLPNLASTNLGSGRNKIFVRGIADSSFNGQLQSTVSQYFGESRITYSAPDPDLALYDIERIEVVEGPQGTLHGAGSLGGVIRIIPRPPVVGELSVSGTAAIGVTGDRLASDGALVANIPIGERAAVRLVGYRIVRPGYIDDVKRGLSDINRTRVSGVRASFQMEIDDNVSIHLGLVSQDTASDDSQYTDEPRSSALTRRSFVAQPFDNDYRLMVATLRADLGFGKLVSNTSYNIHPIRTVFDATPRASMIPVVFEEDTKLSLLTHETRISGDTSRISNWVTGFSFAHNVNNTDRLLGPADALASVSNVRSETLDAALFGEASLPLWHDVSFTAGGRLSVFARFDEFNTEAGQAPAEPTRPEIRFMPTAALAWRPRSDVIGYLRYQEGFRPGAEQLTGIGDEATVTRFQSDAVRAVEMGMRFGTDAGSPLSGGISYALSRWSRVQADLVTSDGFPYVANLGSAQVRYLSANLAWQVTPKLRFGLSGFHASSHLDRPTPQFEDEAEANLPNVADRGGRLTGRFEPWVAGTKITLDGSIGYIGTSYLGISAPFVLSQGDYLDTSLGARAEFGRWGLSLDLENLLDSRGNRFSYGNPFSVTDGNQRTPLRPRTVRIGIDARF